MASTLKPIELKSGSILLKLAEMGDVDEWDIRSGHVDSCTLNKAILKGIGFFLFASALAMTGFAIATFIIADFIAFLVSGFINGWVIPHDETMALFFVSGVICIFALVAVSILTISRGSKAATHTELYRTWKDKYCRPVTFKE